MKTRYLILFIILLLPAFLPAQQPAAKTGQKPATLETKIIDAKATGDLDSMIQRRLIRVLVAYNKMVYFIDKDTQRGTAYDAMKLFETELNKKKKLGKLGVHVVFIPVSRDELIKGLNEGRGDISIAGLTITPERQKMVDFSAPVYTDVSEIVITGPGAPAIDKLDDLAGKEVYIRQSSSYYESIMALNRRFNSEGKQPVIIKPASENLETEDILEMVNAGLVKITIADSYLGTFWKQIFPNLTLHPTVAVRTGANLGWAIRKNSPLLEAELDSFIKIHGKGTTFGNTTLQKYLKSVKYVKNATSQAEMKKFTDTVALFRKYGEKYQVDWLLMGAQGYQESRLDQNAKSQVGAIGVMQLMPATGKDMKVGDIAQTEANIHAGIKYMRFMMDQYYKDEPMDNMNKILMTFASYNCGPGRMKSLRAETAQKGYNPNVWFGNVERIAAMRVGQETVTYVSNIYKYYLAYKLSIEEMEQRKKAKEAAKTGQTK